MDVELVVLHATVRDRKGRFVSGLQKQDFRVYENDQPQTIELFQHEDVPVAVGLVVDNSGSMQPKQSDVAAAALAFVRSSNAEDEMFVVNFNENVTFGLPNTELFSAKPSELDGALMGVPARGKTALYDAIEAALTHLQKASRDKKVLIVISDGGDNASKHTLNQVLQDAERSDAIIYTIGLFDEYDTDRNPRVLKQIARATGGEAFFPEKTSAVVKICEGIAAGLRNQYTIGYSPTNRTARWQLPDDQGDRRRTSWREATRAHESWLHCFSGSESRVSGLPGRCQVKALRPRMSVNRLLRYGQYVFAVIGIVALGYWACVSVNARLFQNKEAHALRRSRKRK